jgi:hypothetical protein
MKTYKLDVLMFVKAEDEAEARKIVDAALTALYDRKVHWIDGTIESCKEAEA